tara:strand:+ start:1823 stop:2482 length:660 start_codon:yes stop_codon:yes gene_type:complete
MIFFQTLMCLEIRGLLKNSLHREEKNILVITGNDKISNYLINEINLLENNLKIIRDRTLNLKKILRLIFKSKSLTFKFLFNTVFSEFLRKNIKVPKIRDFRNKKELNDLLSEFKPDFILVFRASYIFPKDIIKDYQIINFHCSDITNELYKGLGSIYKSYKLKEGKPKVSVHRITPEIDDGEILLQKEYFFDFNKGYTHNENLAFKSGIDTLISFIKNF